MHVRPTAMRVAFGNDREAMSRATAQILAEAGL